MVKLAWQFGININTNFSRERLSGGNPRKTQLRMKSSDAERFFTQIGLVSPAKMERAREMYGAKGLRERDAENMPGLVVIDKAGGSRSATRQKVTTVRSAQTVGRNRQTATTTYARESKPVQNAKQPSEQKRKLTTEERAKIVVGCTVKHKTLGIGKVTSIDDKHIKVKLDGKERMFMFPDAFEGGYLKL